MRDYIIKFQSNKLAVKAPSAHQAVCACYDALLEEEYESRDLLQNLDYPHDVKRCDHLDLNDPLNVVIFE